MYDLFVVANFFSKKVANRIRLKDYIHNNALWQKWFTEENKGKKLATPGKPKKRKTDNDQPMVSFATIIAATLMKTLDKVY